MPAGSQPIGLLCGFACACSHARALPDPLTVPQCFTLQVHPSVSSSSTELLRLASRSTLFSVVHYLPGLPPSSRHGLAASTHCEDSHILTTFRPQAFSASRRFAPPPAARAYFIPKPRPGFHLFRGFSLHTVPPPSSDGVAPMPLNNFALPTRRQCPRSASSTSRPCSVRSSVPLVRLLASPSVAPLIRFSSPSRFSARAVSPGYPGPFAHEVCRSGLPFLAWSTAETVFQVLQPAVTSLAPQPKLLRQIRDRWSPRRRPNRSWVAGSATEFRFASSATEAAS